jgi:hypothetical protein
MLGVVLVLAEIEKLDAGGEMLGLVPGVVVDAPAARGEQTRKTDDQDQCQARRR